MCLRRAPRVAWPRHRRLASSRLHGRTSTLPPSTSCAVSVQALRSSGSSPAGCLSPRAQSVRPDGTSLRLDEDSGLFLDAPPLLKLRGPAARASAVALAAASSARSSTPPPGMLQPPPAALSTGLPACVTLEAAATTSPLPAPAVVLAELALARRRSDPTIGGRMRRSRRFCKSGVAFPATSRPPNEQLRDPAVVVEGLGSLSLSTTTTSGGSDSVEVPLPDCAALSSPSLLLDPSLSFDEDDDYEVLAYDKGVVFGPVHSSAEVCHDGKVTAEPYGGLSATVLAVGDDGDWVQVGRGGRPGREPPSSIRKEGLERSLAFKRWARGRCFRCLEHGHQVSTCRGPFRCIRCRQPGHRERYCYARSPAAPDSRARSSDARAPCQQSHSPSAQPRHPSSSRSWAEVTCSGAAKALS